MRHMHLSTAPWQTHHGSAFLGEVGLWSNPGGKSGKESACQYWWRKRCLHPWVGKIPWRRKRQPTPVFLPGKVHGQRSLAGYSPWSQEELDTWMQTRGFQGVGQGPAWGGPSKEVEEQPGSGSMYQQGGWRGGATAVLRLAESIDTAPRQFLPFFGLFFKAFTEFVTLLFLFYLLVFWPQGVWGLNSLNREPNLHSSCWQVKSLQLDHQGSPSSLLPDLAEWNPIQSNELWIDVCRFSLEAHWLDNTND